MPDTAPKPLQRLLTASYRLGCAAALSALAALLLGRTLHYALGAHAPRLAHLRGSLMIVEAQAFLWPWAYTVFLLVPIVIALALALWVLRARLVRWEGERLRLGRPVRALTIGALLWTHYLLDLNPALALGCAASLVPAGMRLCVADRPGLRVVRALEGTVWLAVAALAWRLASDAADAIALLAWFGFVLLSLRARHRVERGDLALAWLLGLAPANLAPAVLPLFLPLHDGVRLGKGLAYHFCELPESGRILASIPGCSAIPQPFVGFDACQQGRIDAFDAATLQPAGSFRFFSPSYFGRLEHMLCLDPDVYVAVQGTREHKAVVGQTALAFDVRRPADFVPDVAGPGLGTSIAYDSVRDAVLFAGEYTHRLARLWRGRGVLEEVDDPALRHDWVQPVDGTRYTGSLTMGSAVVDTARDRLYVAEWMQGRSAFALDLDSLRVAERFAIDDGGAPGTVVDAKLDRLYVVGAWGLTVIDLRTSQVIRRLRLGLGTHPPVIDPVRNVLFVASAVEGKIRAFDRETLALRATIPIGLGTRNPFVSRDGRLFASSLRHHYVFERAALDALLGSPSRARAP